MKRQAECEVAVMAMAEIAIHATLLKVGDAVQVTGFLTKKSKNSDRLVLHLNKLDWEPH